MNDKEKEIMLIAQEECAEVVQAISKVFRFGKTDEYNGQTNQQRLEEEIGDLMCMIELMQEYGIISATNVLNANVKKRLKLRKWSSVFNEETAIN
jgi:NTP pyrophosphatase (non-canonical NTP hydrolase)